MKVKKENGKYYVNDLDLEKVMANRKYIINYIKKSQEECLQFLANNTLIDNDIRYVFKGKLEVYKDLLDKLELRK